MFIPLGNIGSKEAIKKWRCEALLSHIWFLYSGKSQWAFVLYQLREYFWIRKDLSGHWPGINQLIHANEPPHTSFQAAKLKLTWRYADEIRLENFKMCIIDIWTAFPQILGIFFHRALMYKEANSLTSSLEVLFCLWERKEKTFLHFSILKNVDSSFSFDVVLAFDRPKG